MLMLLEWMFRSADFQRCHPILIILEFCRGEEGKTTGGKRRRRRRRRRRRDQKERERETERERERKRGSEG